MFWRSIRKILKKVVILSSMTVLCGCSAMFEQETKPTIQAYDVTTSLDELPSGLYIRQDGMLSVPYNNFKSYSSFAENNYNETKDTRIIWYTSQEDLVPSLKDEGIIIYKSEKNIPEYFLLESFEHLCDSVGIKGLAMNANGKYVISSAGSFQSASTAAVYLQPYLEKGTIILDTVNGTPIDSTMINKAGAIIGLEDGKKYRFGFYIGTRYFEQDLIADTHIYASKTYYKLSSFEMTKNGYLIVRLPELLTPGLYDLASIGTFWYGGITTATHEGEFEVLETSEADIAVQESIGETLPLIDYADIPVETVVEETLPSAEENVSEESDETETDENGEPVTSEESEADMVESSGEDISQEEQEADEG